MLQRRSAGVFRLPTRFRRLWLATGVSNIGDGVRATALPLLATELTNDPRLIAGVTIAERIPWLLLILPGGVFADRYDRRKLRVRLDIARAVAMAVLAVLVVTDNASIVAVFIVAALLASAESIVDSSSMAMVPSLVPDDQLERAGGLMWSTEMVAGSLIGPPLGGLLFAGALTIPFGFDAMTFVIAAMIASTISGSFVADAAPTTAQRSFLREIGAGFVWLWRRPLLRNLALISTLLGLVTTMHAAIFVVYARDELGLGPVGFGVLLVPGAVGGVAGSLLAPKLKRWCLSTVLTAVVGIGGLAVFLIASTQLAVVVGILTAIDTAAILVWNVLTVALRQRLIPDELLGRVSASYRFVVYAAMPAGALLGGLLASSLSVRAVFLIAGAGQVAIAVLIPVAARPHDPSATQRVRTT